MKYLKIENFKNSLSILLFIYIIIIIYIIIYLIYLDKNKGKHNLL